MSQYRLPAAWMRGGASKGLFLRLEDLPTDPAERDHLILRALGSPDPYGNQMDGMGGGTASTSKVALVSRSEHADCDVDYTFGHVAVDRPQVDWSGNCGNLSAAVGPFAIEEGLVDAVTPITPVRIWQANLGERIIAHVPVHGQAPAVSGDTALAGVSGAGAGIRLDFLGAPEPDPALPTGRAREPLTVPGVGTIEATLLATGNPTVFLRAGDLGLNGTEQPGELTDPALLQALEAIRGAGAAAMGLAAATDHNHAPPARAATLVLVAPPRPMTDSSGNEHDPDSLDLVARMLVKGRPHHAFTSTGANALAVAARIPGTVVNGAARPRNQGVRFGHAAGRLEVDASVTCRNGNWYADRVSVTRSARRLMEGAVLIPSEP